MADTAKTVEIIFSGIDNVSAMTTKIGSDITDLGQGVSDITAPLANAAEALIKFEGALAALAAGGLVYAFNASKNFESAQIDLDKVLRDGESSEAAARSAIELSDAYGSASTEILQSTAEFKQAGFDLDAAMKLTKDSMDLVIAGGLDAADASNLLVAAMKGFGLEADQANRYTDLLNNTSENYATNVEELARGMARLSPVATAMGFSLEETAGALTPVIEVFRSGPEAANALRTGFARLTDDMKPVQDALRVLGVSQTDVNGEMRSGRDIFFDVANAMQGLNSNQQAFYTAQLVGIEQAPKMTQVFREMDKVMAIAGSGMESVGSIAREVAKRLESSEVSVDRFKTAFQNLGVAIGNEFRDSAKGAIDGATDIENALRGLVEQGAFNDVLDIVSTFSEEIGLLFSQIAQNLPEAIEGVDFGALTDGIKSVGESLSGVFDGLDLSTPEGLREAIQKAVDALGGLQNAVAGIITGITPIIKAIESLITSFSSLDPAVQNIVGQILGFGAALSALATILAVGGAVLSGLGALGAAFSTGGVLSIGLAGIVGLLSGPAGVVVAIGTLASAAVTAWNALDKWSLDNLNEELKESSRVLDAEAEKVQAFYERVTELSSDVNTIDIYAAIDSGDFDKALELIRAEEEKEHYIEIDTIIPADSYASLEELQEDIANLPEEVQTKLYTTVDTNSKSEVQKFILEYEKGIETEVKPVVDEKAAAEAQKQLDKLAQIELKGSIDTQLAQIKASAETAQAAFEWTAKVNIEEAKAQAEILTAAYSSIDNTIKSTENLISQSLSTLGDFDTIQQKWAAGDILREEQDLREKSVASQIELNKAQVDYMNARTEAINSGDIAIEVSADGLEPTLEMIMWQILEKVQLRANASSADFLLGIT
jgi:TP901 family phage tail tape measure protein